ncbi:MAG: VWA domain-containing protein [Chloroflexi bacterium]|nr:VWA domain-containing protein [Chloroflexota bacterium]
MSFTNPNALFLLALLPVLAFVGWPRLSYRRRRDVAGLVIRLILVTLLIIGLAGPQIERAADKLAVVFLVDVSDSVSPAVQSAAVQYVRAAADVMGEKDQAAVIVFGSDALVEIPITDRLELVQLGSDPIRLNTDLAEALRLGLALFPADTAKRMVVLTDGKQTVGDAEEVARLAAATDVQIDYVFLGPGEVDQAAAGPEIMISNVDVPSSVNEGERFNVTVSITSSRANSQAEVRVMSGGRIIHRREVELPSGTTNVVFESIAPSAGFVDFHVIVEPRSADTFYQNNQLSAFTQVSGPPRVLLVASDEREIADLRSVLEESGLQVDVQGPRDLPVGLAPLSSYDSIVMANVSAADLTQDRMAYLQAYVRDLGGGLVVIGGPNSYGVGGYFQTPLEETLPVEMRIRDQERIPQLTMLFVIDRSGSMEVAGGSGVSNLELAKEAVARSFDLLNDNDRTGVLSFDVSAYYVIDIQEVGDTVHRQQLRATIGTLRPGGGTNIYQGIRSADEVLSTDPSDLKHIILLTDGGSDPSGIAAAVGRMYQNYGITTSVIAVGQDYARWLQDVAVAGNGQFHLVYDVSTIPAIFTAETMLATRSYIFEEDFFALLNARHPIMEGLDSTPQLKGYVATSPKETATVILRGPEDDPILAAWQYGLGRAVAFTSDATSRWAVNWLPWDGYADFWNQAVRWSITESDTGNIEAQIIQRGEQAVLMVDVRDNRGNYLNGLQLDAAVVSAQLDTYNLPLMQTAPGQYEAVFSPEDEGAYFITVAGSAEQTADVLTPESIMQTTGWVLSYSAEYRVDNSAEGAESPQNLLQRVADLTGGISLRDDPERSFVHDLNQEQAAQPIWQYFVFAALLLLPLDVGVRRLVISRSDAERVRARLTAPFTRQRGMAAAESPERMGRLLDAKDRARSSGPAAPAEPLAPPPKLDPKLPRPRRDLPKSTPSVTAKKPAEKTPSPSQGSLASRLLERRREGGDQDKQDK